MEVWRFPTKPNRNDAALKTDRHVLSDGATAPRVQLAASQLDTLVTRRVHSLFRDDIAGQVNNIESMVRDRRVLVVGGAGSIGAAATHLLIEYGPKSVHVVDHSENYLVGARSRSSQSTSRTGGLDPIFEHSRSTTVVPLWSGFLQIRRLTMLS
jgi:hypothetical protein